jgi:hypothetical protein
MAVPTLKEFMQGAVPGDLTLAELRAYALTTEELRGLAALAKTGKAGLRFLHQPGGKEFDDSTPLSEFRALAAVGRASVTIDDGTGGLRVMEPA